VLAAFVWHHRSCTIRAQYSSLVATVIGSAVVPTLIANAFYLPHHLLPRTDVEEAGAPPIGAVASSQAE